MTAARNNAATPEVDAPNEVPARSSFITAATQQAFLVGKDAAFNLVELIANGSIWAFRAIGESEKELDSIERAVDEVLPKAIARVAEKRARELLACVRFITELERIADLLLDTARQLRGLSSPLTVRDRHDLQRMAAGVQKMMDESHAAITKREVSYIASVLRADRDIDRLRSSVFQRHLQTAAQEPAQDRVRILFAAQALERAGDHVTNIAEEAYRLISGGTLRHVPAKEKASKLGGRDLE
jgi:phosphate transport system protein